MGVFYSKYEGPMDPPPKFRMTNSELGAPTNPTIAKQLEEFGKLLNQGIKNIEIGTLSADKFEAIPKEHFTSIRQLAKLTGTKPSVHGPMMDLAGFDERNGKWSEETRKGTERQVLSIFERAKELDPEKKGNVPIVFHAGAVFAQEYRKGLMEESRTLDEKGNETIEIKPYDRGVSAMGVVNQDTGDVTRLEYEKKFSIRDGKEHIWTPDNRLNSLNQTQWDEEQLKVLAYQKEITDLREKIEQRLKQNEAIVNAGLSQHDQYAHTILKNDQELHLFDQHLEHLRQKMESSYTELYDRFQKFAKEEDKKEFGESFKKIKDEFNFKELRQKAQESFQQAHKIQKQLTTSEDPEEQLRLRVAYREAEVRALDYGALLPAKALVTATSEMKAPDIWRPVGDFAKEKTVETVSNVILEAYKRYKDQTPFIAIENFWTNTPMSTAKELADAVEKSREALQKKLMHDAKLKMPEGEAKKVAEKLIGATWDIGHINNLRKAGWEGEELKKKIIEETKEIAKHNVVKHVHITDNFGFFDSHFPPGMGNVPVKEIMEELEKQWAQQRASGRLPQDPRGIVEAGGFVAEIGQNPTQAILSYFESPFYAHDPNAGSWNTDSKPFYSGYRNSFIEFPQTHFNLYGSSFTTLPREVGGQIGGEKSRFSDTPNT
ncbi:hypothetical protein HZB00_00840 [Candidatus Woesearchaeota archaeon]|nr:hypothetical protein [Candidatus Woesearchaeota archaeon]